MQHTPKLVAVAGAVPVLHGRRGAQNMKESNRRKLVAGRVSVSDHHLVKAAAAAEGRSVSDLVAEAVMQRAREVLGGEQGTGAEQ